MSDVIWERTDYPPEPAGPVWDQDGVKWERREIGLWRGPRDLQWAWRSLCANSRKITSTPPWKPEVGGIVETEEQYAALPEGSIVSSSSANPYLRGGRSDGGYWFGIGCDDKFSNLYMARTSRTILRVGWESGWES